MDPRARHDRVHDLLGRARELAAGGHHALRAALLEEATALLDGSADRALARRTGWRFAKAAYDADDPDAIGRALDRLLACEGACDEPEAWRALPRLAQRVWDRVGHHDERPAQLWHRLEEHHARAGDPWLAATAQSQRAWHLACRGDLAALDAIVDAMVCRDPRSFGDGPSRHPDAPDAPSSVWWAQIALLRTALWSAAWTARASRARDLLDALFDATDAARVSVAADPWLVDPAARAALVAGDAAVCDELVPAWRACLARADHPRASFHADLAAGLTGAAPDLAVSALERAADRAARGAIGPEWEADAWCRAAERANAAGFTVRAEGAAQRARALVERFGLGGVRLPETSAGP